MSEAERVAAKLKDLGAKGATGSRRRELLSTWSKLNSPRCPDQSGSAD